MWQENSSGAAGSKNFVYANRNRHCVKYCATIWGEKCCTSKLLLSYFQDRQFFSMMHMCMITIFTGVFYLHDFKGRSLVENAWNGHQTIVWEDFRLFSTNDWCLWRRVYFLYKSSIMSLLYRGTTNLLVKSAVYAVILCIKGKIWNAEVRCRLAGVSLYRCGYSEGSRLGCQILFYAKGHFGQKYFLSCHFDVCSLF